MSTPELAHLLTGLSSAAAKLNSVSDDLNRVIASVERQLVEANVGVETWVPQALHSTERELTRDGGSSWVSQFVGFAKLDGDWCLAIKFVRYQDGFFDGDLYAPYQNEYAEQAPVRLSKAPRDIRIAALEKMPQLVQLLTEAANNCSQIIEKARSHAT